MRLCLFNHHGKADYLGQTLANLGFEFSEDAERFDYQVLLVDSDHPEAPPVPYKHNMIKAAVARGIPIVLYPHGGPPDLDMDGLRRSDIPISVQLVSGEGHAEINRRFGSRRRIEVVGWTLGKPLLPEANGGVPDHLVFAPIHPWANGADCLPRTKHLNAVAYQQFLAHPAPHKTVRMFGLDAPNGVTRRVEGVEYTPSDLGPAEALISVADAVISHGTLAYTALARGKRTVFIDPYPPFTSDRGDVTAAHLDDYAEYSRYPASIGDAPLDELFDVDVAEWKRLFVGEALDAEKLAGILTGLRPNRATRRKLARV